jgi:hypothetical protein
MPADVAPTEIVGQEIDHVQTGASESAARPSVAKSGDTSEAKTAHKMR